MLMGIGENVQTVMPQAEVTEHHRGSVSITQSINPACFHVSIMVKYAKG